MTEFKKNKEVFKGIVSVLNNIFGRVEYGSPYKLTHSMMKLLNSQVGESNESKIRFYKLLLAYLKRATDYSLERKNGDHLIEIEFGGEPLSMTFNEWNNFYIDDNIKKLERRIEYYAKLNLKDMIDTLDPSSDDSLDKISEFVKKYLKDVHPKCKTILDEIASFKYLRDEGANPANFKESLLNSVELIK